MKPVFRASELDRILSCNGSITLVPLVTARDGDEGFEGTMIHWMIADRLVREYGAIPPEGGLPPPDVPKGYKLPGNAIWLVDWCIRHVAETIPQDWSLMVEVAFHDEYERWDNTGHADVVAISPDTTESRGIDWKTGRDPVDPADNNWQIFDYIVQTKSAWPTVRKATFQIVQPRVTEEDDVERISTVVIEGDRLEMAGPTLDGEVCNALDNRMELRTSRKACNWCAAATQCPAIIAEREFMKSTLTPEILATIKRTPNDQQLADWAISIKTLNRPMDDAMDMAKARIAERQSIVAGDGTIITAKVENGAYKVPDPDAFLSALRVLLPTDGQLSKCVTFSQTRIKDTLAEVMNIPKSGTRAAVTAESVHAAHLRPLVEQGTRTKLIFSV